MINLNFHTKILFRRINSGKFITFVKISSIAIALNILLLVLAFVKHEISYDKSFKDSERIFRVIRNWQEDKIYGAYTPVPFLKALNESFPQVETGTRLWPIGAESVMSNNKVFYNEQIIAVDSSFIETFNLKLIQGNSKTALRKPNTVIISNKICQKYFPDGNVLGQTLILGGSVYESNNDRFTVTGIFDDFPETSHLQADLLLSLHSFEIANWPEHRSHNLIAYVKLNKASDKKDIEALLPNFLNNFYGKEYYDYARSTYKLQPLSDIHLDTTVSYNTYETPKGSSKSFYVFSLLSALILVIAIINFITLAIADNRRKKTSFGINKLLGARNRHIAKYFLQESVLLNITALIIAFVFVFIFAKPFEKLVNRNIDFSFLYNFPFIGIIVISVLLLGTINSFFPYLRFLRISALQNSFLKNYTRKTSKRFRQSFQIVQFGICIFLLSGSIIIYKQLSYVNNKIESSIEKENVLVLRNLRQLGSNRESFKQELLKQPEVISASICGNVPGIHYYSHWGYPVDQAIESVHIADYRGDYDYIETLGIKLVQGRFFNHEFRVDNKGIVLNETAVKRLGWDNPIGKRYAFGNRTFTVIGVTEDFHFERLQESIIPLGITLPELNDRNIMLVKINSEEPDQAIDKLKVLWKNFIPDRELQFSFLDDEFSFWYEIDRRTGAFTLILSLVAILLSSMGLMAIVLDTIQNQIKEIGIRKVNGAKIWELLAMLNKDFVIWIVIAFIIATPISWYVMNKWLENFAYRTEISWWVFVLSGALALVIALLTVSWQSWRAASRNPVEALRYE